MACQYKLTTVTINDALTPTIIPQFGSAGDLASTITAIRVRNMFILYLDDQSSLTWSLAGADQNLFSIDATTGRLEFINAQILTVCGSKFFR